MNKILHILFILAISFASFGQRMTSNGSGFNYGGSSWRFSTYQQIVSSVMNPYEWPEMPSIDPRTDWTGDTFYVATTGSDAANGTSTSTPWQTINYALSASSGVGPGDLVIVKAGNYSSVWSNIWPSISGEKSSPIFIRGANSSWSLDVKNDWAHGDAMDPSAMPYFKDGNRIGKVLYCNNKPYLDFANFQIENGGQAIYTSGSPGCEFTNFYCTEQGDTTINDTGCGIQIVGNNQAPAGGQSALPDSDSTILRNITITENPGVGIQIWSDYCTVIACDVKQTKSYSTEPSGRRGMDYYITIVGRRDTVAWCTVERDLSVDHTGHGIGTRGVWIANQGFNVFEYNTVIGFEGEALYTANQNDTANIFRYNRVVNSEEGLVNRDGSTGNTFEYNILDTIQDLTGSSNGSVAAISLRDFYEQGEEHSGKRNIFRGNLIRNADVGIAIWSPDDYVNSEAEDNKFYHNVFYGVDTLIRIEEPNAGNELKNNVFYNVSNYSSNSGFTDNFLFEYNDFWSGFTNPGGTGNISVNPQFINADGNNFEPASGSGIINTGVDVGYDFNGISPDMGPVETNY